MILEYDFNKEGKLSPELVIKNIELAETGGELTVPLAILKRYSNFKNKWYEIQNKWHPIKRCSWCRKEIEKGGYCSEECYEKIKEYYQRPEVIAKRKAYYQRKKQEKQNE